MSNDRRLKRLEDAFDPTIERGHGSAYATIRDWLGWWLQPVNIHRFAAMWDECWPGWVDRFGEVQVVAVFQELCDELGIGEEDIRDEAWTPRAERRVTGELKDLIAEMEDRIRRGG